ncbi:MAG: BspA family leucine-rich repeat surface protein, partial [archaeon]|nr:BspA family leucine-rich repeat surface protein [archaeon]
EEKDTEKEEETGEEHNKEDEVKESPKASFLSEFYCTDCKKPYCKNCFKLHNIKKNPSKNASLYFNHKSLLIKENGLLINPKCEDIYCGFKMKSLTPSKSPTKEIKREIKKEKKDLSSDEIKIKKKDPLPNIEYYCIDCKMNICLNCKETNHLNHKTLKIKEYFKKEIKEMENLPLLLKNLSNHLKSENSEYLSYLNDISKIIEKSKKYLEEKIKEERNIIKFYKSLANTYETTKDIPNFNILNNISINISNSKLENLAKEAEIIFKTKIQKEFSESKSLKFLDKILNTTYIEAKYYVQEKNDLNYSNDIINPSFGGLSDENCFMLIDDRFTSFRKKFKEGDEGKEHKVEFMIGKDIINIPEYFIRLKSKLLKKNEDLQNISKPHVHSVKSFKNLFKDCISLYSVKISSLNNKILDFSHSFSHCVSLLSVDLNNFDGTYIRNMNGTFSNCCRLNSLDLSNMFTPNLNSINGLFYECTSLTYLNLSNFQTGSVTDMKSVFSGCKSLAYLDLSSFDTKNVKDLEGFLYDCSSLLSINLSNFNTQNVTSFEYSFFCCNSLKSLNLSKFNTTKATSMNNMFAGCSSLISLDLSGFNTRTVTNMDYMFSGCSSLSSLNINVVSKAKESKGIFNGCNKLNEEVKGKFKKKGIFG